MARIAPEWAEVLTRCGVRPRTAAIWSEVFAAVIREGTFSAGEFEIDDFLGQVLHESALLERLEEGMSYSVERLMQVWPRRFPSRAAAEPYARNPERLANHVYAGRLGNIEPGDGWRYRGRGLIQVTGRSNYEAVHAAIGIDCVRRPELLAEPLGALQSAVAWWEGRIPDAVMGDVVRVTRLVNGGTVGLADRKRLTSEAREALA